MTYCKCLDPQLREVRGGAGPEAQQADEQVQADSHHPPAGPDNQHLPQEQDGEGDQILSLSVYLCSFKLEMHIKLFQFTFFAMFGVALFAIFINIPFNFFKIIDFFFIYSLFYVFYNFILCFLQFIFIQK